MTTKAEREAAEKKAATKLSARERAEAKLPNTPAASEEINVPKTTAATVDDDVTKVAIVSPGAQPIDEKATRETIEQDRAETEAREEANPLSETPYMFIDDPNTRQRYVAIPPADDELSIHNTQAAVLIKTPLSIRAPEGGIQVYPESGEPFVIPRGTTDWMAVRTPDGEPLIAAVAKKSKKAA